MNDKFFEEMLRKSEEEAESLNDEGHTNLVMDTYLLLQKIRGGYYHDFHRNGAPAPKIELAEQFRILRENVINGKYDN